MVVPLPLNGSYTACPGELLFSIGRFMHSTGFWVPCPVSFFLGLAMCQTVVCLRSPAQWPFAPFFTAYQQGSCSQ